MSDKCNTMEFGVHNYAEKGTFNAIERRCFNEDQLFKDVTAFIRILTKNGYMCKVRYDGITCSVEYNFEDESISNVSLEWVGEGEYVEQIQKEFE